MSYLVTARKWRPMVFEDVAGQDHVSTTLRNAIASNRLSHAYLFSGPRGVGKTTMARILAKAINCLHPKENNPDNSCELCAEITEGRSLNVFEIDGASNRGVDEIRNLREAVRYGPSKGNYKVYIIDEVHMLTKEAFNALLKTLEEPPGRVLFIFATTEVQKVPLTILSRCQRFDFRRISVEVIMHRLRFIAAEESISIDDDALLLIAKRADGSLRDAQSLFDQIVSYCGTTVTSREIIDMLNLVDEELFFRMSDLLVSRDSHAVLDLVDEIMRRGYDIRDVLNGLLEHLRSLLVVRSTGSTRLIETSEGYRKRFEETAGHFTETDLLRYMKIASDIEAGLRWSPQPRLKFEIGLLQMTKMDQSVEIDELLRNLEEIKKKANGSSPQRAIGHPLPAEARDETEIRGSVKASQPILRPDQIVPGYPRIGLYDTLPAGAAVNPPGPTIGRGLPADEASMKWSLLIDEARKQRIALGTLLSESHLVEVMDNRLRVGCPDDFHLDALRRNRSFLSDLAEKVYGAKFRLEGILAKDTHHPSSAREPSTVKASVPSATTEGMRNHPVILAILREFAAQEID